MIPLRIGTIFRPFKIHFAFHFFILSMKNRSFLWHLCFSAFLWKLLCQNIHERQRNSLIWKEKKATVKHRSNIILSKATTNYYRKLVRGKIILSPNLGAVCGHKKAFDSNLSLLNLYYSLALNPNLDWLVFPIFGKKARTIVTSGL